MIRLQVALEQDEAQALLALSESELRDPREQLRHLLRLELQRQRRKARNEVGKPKDSSQEGGDSS